jgi:hypothetical protein
MAVADGRCRAGNTPMGTLSRLAAEIAYTQKRLCLRHQDVVQECLKIAAAQVEEAMRYIEESDRLNERL